MFVEAILVGCFKSAYIGNFPPNSNLACLSHFIIFPSRVPTLLKYVFICL